MIAYTYLMCNKRNGTLYVGVTTNLYQRIYQHKNGIGSSFCKKHNLKKLIYYKEYQFIEDAIADEKRVKKRPRKWKLNMIESENSNWVDLAENWYD